MKMSIIIQLVTFVLSLTFLQFLLFKRKNHSSFSSRFIRHQISFIHYLNTSLYLFKHIKVHFYYIIIIFILLLFFNFSCLQPPFIPRNQQQHQTYTQLVDHLNTFFHHHSLGKTDRRKMKI